MRSWYNRLCRSIGAIIKHVPYFLHFSRKAYTAPLDCRSRIKRVNEAACQQTKHTFLTYDPLISAEGRTLQLTLCSLCTLPNQGNRVEI